MVSSRCVWPRMTTRASVSRCTSARRRREDLRACGSRRDRRAGGGPPAHSRRPLPRRATRMPACRMATAATTPPTIAPNTSSASKPNRRNVSRKLKCRGRCLPSRSWRSAVAGSPARADWSGSAASPERRSAASRPEEGRLGVNHRQLPAVVGRDRHRARSEKSDDRLQVVRG